MSKGIRIYFHDKGKRLTRECHNYWTGQEVVEDLMADRSAEIISIGSEDGAMCLHYRRI